MVKRDRPLPDRPFYYIISGHNKSTLPTVEARGRILDSRVRTANLLQDATSAEPKPGVFAIVRWIGARSANDCLQTRQIFSL